MVCNIECISSGFRGGRVRLLQRSPGARVTQLSMAPVLAFGMKAVGWFKVVAYSQGFLRKKCAGTVRRINVPLVNAVRYTRGYEIF